MASYVASSERPSRMLRWGVWKGALWMAIILRIDGREGKEELGLLDEECSLKGQGMLTNVRELTVFLLEFLCK